MREIGKTTEGESIIALTEEESIILAHLQDALDGLSVDWFKVPSPPLKDYDSAPVFRAIWLWTRARFKANELQRLVDDFKKELGENECIKSNIATTK